MKKLAMIGCGNIGGYHLGHFLKYDDVELAGFCDLIPERTQAFVEKAGSGKAFTDWREMYDEIKPDMVFICIPPYAHGELEFETIRRGIPMFVEKPVALDLKLAYRIRDAIREANLITAVGFQCRYASIVGPTQEFAKEHPILYVNCCRMGGIPSVPWWGDKKLSGGQIVEQTIHNYDMIRYIMGEPTEVYTLGARGFVSPRPGYYTDALSTTSIRFESGALGSVSTGCYAESGTCSNADALYLFAIVAKKIALSQKRGIFSTRPPFMAEICAQIPAAVTLAEKSSSMADFRFYRILVINSWQR